MQYYGVLGTGDAKKRVIEEGLADYTDRSEKTMALVPWFGTPTDGMERVYDWLIDHEQPFVLVPLVGHRVPKALARAAEHVVDDQDNPAEYILRELQIQKGDLLILFDTEDEAGSQELVLAGIDAKLSVLELNNGLAVLTADDDDEEPQEPQEEQRPEPAEDTAEPLTEAEVRAMTAAEMRAHAKSIGIDTKGMVKADLLQLLLERINGPAEILPRSEDPAVRKVTDTLLGVTPEDDDPITVTETNGHEVATVVIVLTDGTTVVKSGVSVEELGPFLPR